MCIMALQKANSKKIEDSTLDLCRSKNKDGCGMMYIKDNKLEVFKTLNYDEFKEKYNQVYKDHNNKPISIHFRLGTEGSISVENCHPFYVGENNNIAFAHNGVLDLEIPEDKPDYSDTRYFGEHILNNIEEDIISNKTIKLFIESFIGNNNKLIIMNNKGAFNILNEKQGDWEEDIWYSNDGYRSYIPQVATSNYEGMYSNVFCPICKAFKPKKESVALETFYYTKFICFDCIKESKSVDLKQLLTEDSIFKINMN